MKKVYIILVIMFCIEMSVFGQTTNTSSPDKMANWEKGSSWTKLGTSSDTVPNLTTSGITANIYGYVTKNKDSGLLLSNGATLNVYGTLVVYDDLTLSFGKITVHPGGVLVVFGNYYSLNASTFINNGTVVVTGNFEERATLTTQTSTTSSFYLFHEEFTDENLKVNNGGKINSNCYNFNCAKDILKNKQSLQQNNPSLYNFVNSGGNGILPVNLLYFKAISQSQSVEVNWASSKAWDFSHYELERSANGLAFDFVATIDAAEFSNETTEYTFSDRQPLSGTSYYRLKAVDIDGAFEYKDMAAVKFGAESFKVYPNPSANGFINLDWSHAVDGATVVLRDHAGRTVLTTSLNGNKNTISTAGLNPGIYLLSIHGPASSKQVQVMIN